MRLEFAFTEHDTPRLRARVTRDLTRIARLARDADAHLEALVLTGGFSRGEGTTRGDAPVNDYDLVAIRSRPGGRALHAGVSDAATREVGLHVDLLPVWRARLPYVGRKLFWLDARLGARVIDGDARALDHLRVFPPERVRAREIARLLGNRAAGMLLSLPRQGEAPDPAERDLQATKAVLAALDASLLHRGRYAARLRERLDLARGHPDHAAFATAVGWKLAEAQPLPAQWWEHARDVLLRAVDQTQASAARDGLAEHALHALRTLRMRRSPSQAVRRTAWELLARSRFPDGPDGWPSLRATFLRERAQTLQ